MNEQQVKGLLQSRTIWSLVAMVIIYLAAQHSLTLPVDEKQLVELLILLGGALSAGIFRVSATKKVVVGTLLKKKPL